MPTLNARPAFDLAFDRCTEEARLGLVPAEQRGRQLPPALVAAERGGELGVAGVKDRRRLAPGEAAALGALRLQLAEEIQEPEADAGPLALGHDDQPAGARLDVALVALVHGGDGQVDAELAVDRSDVIGGPDHARQLAMIGAYLRN